LVRKRQVLVVGLGRFGSAVATTLAELDCEVACVDSDERRIQRISPLVTQAMQLDSTDRDALSQVGVGDFDVAVVAIGADVEASILTTANLSELGCNDIVAKALTLPHARILEKVGAHRVVFPEHEMGVRLGNSLAGTNLIDYMELDPRYAVAEIRCPAEISGRTLTEANVRGRYGVIVLCVKTGDHVDVIPDADKRLEKSDIIVVAGPTKDIDRLAR
jgi:trk system potassium uptake protein TrkA